MKRDSQVLIRLSKEEKQAFEDAANLSGVSLSSWIRQRLRHSSIRELQDANQAIAFLPAITMKDDQ